MSFEPILPTSRGHPLPDTVRLSLSPKKEGGVRVRVALGPRLAATMGWQAEAEILPLVGRDEDLGRLLLRPVAAGERGFRLIREKRQAKGPSSLLINFRWPRDWSAERREATVCSHAIIPQGTTQGLLITVPPAFLGQSTAAPIVAFPPAAEGISPAVQADTPAESDGATETASEPPAAPEPTASCPAPADDTGLWCEIGRRLTHSELRVLEVVRKYGVPATAVQIAKRVQPLRVSTTTVYLSTLIRVGLITRIRDEAATLYAAVKRVAEATAHVDLGAPPAGIVEPAIQCDAGSPAPAETVLPATKTEPAIPPEVPEARAAREYLAAKGCEIIRLDDGYWYRDRWLSPADLIDLAEKNLQRIQERLENAGAARPE